MSDKTIEEIMNYTNRQAHGKIPANDNVIKWNCLLARTYCIINIIKFLFLYGFLNVQTVVTDLMGEEGGWGKAYLMLVNNIIVVNHINCTLPNCRG